MTKYVVDSNSTNRSDVSLSCKLGNYSFVGGQILTKEQLPVIDELVKLFPKLFLKIADPEEVPDTPVQEVENPIQEEIPSQEEVETIEEEEVPTQDEKVLEPVQDEESEVETPTTESESLPVGDEAPEKQKGGRGRPKKN